MGSEAIGSAAWEREPEATTPKKRTVPSRKRGELAAVHADTTPSWLRNLHWLLILALIPLAFSLLSADDDHISDRFARTIEAMAEEDAMQVAILVAQLEKGAAGEKDLFALFPDNRLVGAHLARDTWAHWVWAAGAMTLFLLFFMFLSTGTEAKVWHVFGFGFFTATIGILTLLMFQFIAANVSFRYARGKLAIIVGILALLAFSYNAALDESNGFALSFFGYTLGVGFCEELCKALPIIFYVKSKPGIDWRTALVLGLASGAGFGISEGIMYSSDYYNGILGPQIYLVRFLSCVALHAVWSGAVAISIQQRPDLMGGRECWYENIPPLFIVLGIPMILHGAYDTLLKKGMNGYALLVAIASFLYLAWVLGRMHGEDYNEARGKALREYAMSRTAAT